MSSIFAASSCFLTHNLIFCPEVLLVIFWKNLIILDCLQRKIQIAVLVTGEACAVRAPYSDVILHVPEGIYGILLGKIRTNLSRYSHLFPHNECVISPICEYSFHQLLDKPAVSRNAKYRIQIPHVARDINNPGQQIIVRHGNIHNGHFRKCLPGKLKEGHGIYYTVSDKYVDVYTSHFSATVVTQESIDCCCRSANAAVFGVLRNKSGKQPLVKLKVFMASLLYNIEDFNSVRLSLYQFTDYNIVFLFNHFILIHL